MRVSRSYWLCLAGLGLTGCVGSASQTLDDSKVNYAGGEPAAVTAAAAPARANGVVSVANAPIPPAIISSMPTPPEGAKYTIYCHAYDGPDHVQVAQLVRDQLAATSGLRKWYVVHGEDQSTLYFGFYRTFDGRKAEDAEEGRRAQGEIDAVRGLADSRGFHIFATALMVPIDEPDPVANKAWDLTRTKGYWSIEIAAYKGTPDRKELAIKAVEAARAEGVEAYYFHGETASSVCIGSWPKDAAVEIGVKDENIDPTKVLVVTPGKLPPALSNQFGDAERISPTVEFRDPTLAEAMRRYPDHSFNGFDLEDPVTHEVKKESSLLVKVPHRDTAADHVRTVTSSHVPANHFGDDLALPHADPTAGGLH